MHHRTTPLFRFIFKLWIKSSKSMLSLLEKKKQAAILEQPAILHIRVIVKTAQALFRYFKMLRKVLLKLRRQRNKKL